MKHLRMILLMFAVIPLTACALSGEAIEGQVLEEGTNKPIPGAIVVVRWQGRVSSFVDSHGVCYHVESATTDEQGKYQTKPWRKPREYGVSFDHIDIDAYKPGYGHPSRLSKAMEIEHLAPLRGTREETFKSIRIAGVKCPGAGESQKNLIPLYKTIYEQLATLALTKDEKFYANSYLNAIEEIELPEEEATRRDLERRERIRNENK